MWPLVGRCLCAAIRTSTVSSPWTTTTIRTTHVAIPTAAAAPNAATRSSTCVAAVATAAAANAATRVASASRSSGDASITTFALAPAATITRLC